MIRACLFDMGNVLVHFSHQRMCRQISETIGVEADQIRSILFDDQLHWDFDRGAISGIEFHQLLCERFSVKADLDSLKLAASDIFELNTPILAILDDLRDLGIRLVLLSNTCEFHYEFIRKRFDVLDRFDGLSMSYQVGAVKPEEPIYLRALELAGCAAGECFYTDDIHSYVTRGREIGFDSEVFESVEQLVSQLSKRGLRLERKH